MVATRLRAMVPSPLLSLLLLAPGLVAGIAAADENNPDGRLYEASADAVADVRQAMEQASASDRRALVVMGANWCHDSRALASRLQQSPLADVVADNYELVFVDVGFYAKGRGVLDELGVPQFYATPTVLIVDPASSQVVNNEDRHIWGNAYNIDMASSVEYFDKWSGEGPVADPAENSGELERLYKEIDRFEERLAGRVGAGYAVVGPMLAARSAGKTPENYQASWDALRDFRMAIPRDVLALRAEAARRVRAGETDIELSYPEYPALAWETE